MNTGTLLRQFKRPCRAAISSHIVFTQTRAFRQDENFTFDWKKVPASLEKEREKFDEYREVVGDARFSDRQESMRQINYVATSDPAAWRFVERLVNSSKPRIIPGGRPLVCNMYRYMTLFWDYCGEKSWSVFERSFFADLLNRYRMQPVLETPFHMILDICFFTYWYEGLTRLKRAFFPLSVIK
jgi:hypothetical protein